MKQFIIFVKKEFYHILRDPKTLIIIIGLPIIQILTFGFALTNEVKNSKIAILNPTIDETTTKIVDRLEASRFFEIEKSINSPNDLDAAFKSGKIRMAVVFQNNFQSNLLHNKKADIQLITDASDPNIATMVSNYATAIINDAQTELNPNYQMPYQINIATRLFYNPQQIGAYSFVPGIMAMVLLLISTMMTSLAIVREKELGSMELLLASPMKPLVLILSKVVPYLIISLFNWLMIVILSVWLMEVPINGSFLLLFLVSLVFIVASLALGLFISSITDSQQVAMMISLMGMLLPTLILSGFMFPIENMPLPLQVVSNIVPSKWYYSIVKDIMIKGLGINAIWKETLVLVGMTLFFIAVSLKKFKIRIS
ncbi:MAG: ABC transporter permease [Saprospiraceae bacterium]|nr:ABC transporter permease [Saprospiraceae bacterium]